MAPGRRIIIGDFELDRDSPELRRDGKPVRLAPQPLRALTLLVERQGEIISREELKRHVWGDETFIDFDQGLNFCIRQIRLTLGDDAESPRYVETVPKRGYRFIGPAIPIGHSGTLDPSTESEVLPAQRETPSASRPVTVPRWTAFAVLALALAAGSAALVVWARDDRRPIGKPMVAVLPFENLSGPGQEYFSDGITEELTTQLARIDPARLGVIARHSAQAYRDAGKTAAQVGEELGVHHFVEGSVRRSGPRVRISARLIRTSDQTQIWAEVFETSVSDIFAVQQEIGRGIARQVLARLSVSRRPPPKTVDPEVYDLYLRGRYHWNRRRHPETLKAMESFREALQRDPSFAMAHAGLGDCLLVTTGFDAALASANAALAIDEELAEAHVTRGHALMHQLRWAVAEPAFRRAIELDSSYPAARYFYAEYLIARGRRLEAIEQALQAVTVDPLSAIASHAAGVISYYAREYDRALPLLRRALELDPAHYWTHGRIALVLERQDSWEEALVEFDQAGVPLRSAYTLASTGRVADVRRIIDSSLALPEGEQDAYHLAGAHAGLGEPDEAIRWLTVALRQRAYDVVYMKVDPRLDSLREMPAFAALLEEGGW